MLVLTNTLLLSVTRNTNQHVSTLSWTVQVAFRDGSLEDRPLLPAVGADVLESVRRVPYTGRLHGEVFGNVSFDCLTYSAHYWVVPYWNTRLFSVPSTHSHRGQCKVNFKAVLTQDWQIFLSGRPTASLSICHLKRVALGGSLDKLFKISEQCRMLLLYRQIFAKWTCI